MDLWYDGLFSLSEAIANKYCDNVSDVGSAVKAGNAMVAIKEGNKAALNI